MNRPTLFLTTAVIFVLIGMAWGIQMSASQNHSMGPAHAHLNLIGFVIMAISAFYYALSPTAAESKLSLVHYLLSLAGVLTIIPGIAIALGGGDPTLAKVGSVLTLVAMLLFLFILLKHKLPVKA